MKTDSQDRPRFEKVATLRLLLLLCSITLGLGLVLPSLTMEPRFWGIEKYVPIAENSTKSILTGIFSLFKSGDIFLSGILFVFSVIFPTWKITVFYSALFKYENGEKLSKVLHVAEMLGKFSLLDVIVMAMLVLSFQSFPGGTRIRIEWGIGFFLISVILSVISGIYIKHFFKDDRN